MTDFTTATYLVSPAVAVERDHTHSFEFGGRTITVRNITLRSTEDPKEFLLLAAVNNGNGWGELRSLGRLRYTHTMRPKALAEALVGAADHFTVLVTTGR